MWRNVSINRLLAQQNSPLWAQQARTRVYQSYKSARPKTVEPVPARFKRLGCGQWIRTRSGRHKRLWKKSKVCRIRMKAHVLCNKRQNWLLERMVGKYWKRHRHYPNDPYAPYHVRNGLHVDRVYHKAPFYPWKKIIGSAKLISCQNNICDGTGKQCM